MQFLNKFTGEVYDLEDTTPEQIMEAWRALSETIKACERAKDKLKPKVSEIVNDKGLYEFEEFQFRVSRIQRYNYDKATMREVLDADLFDTLLEPNKTAVDKYIKENVEIIGDTATVLRSTMQPTGNPYQVIKLEKL